LIQSHEYNFTEIGQLFDYNNVNYLSIHFIIETGMSLTKHKGLNMNFRNFLRPNYVDVSKILRI